MMRVVLTFICSIALLSLNAQDSLLQVNSFVTVRSDSSVWELLSKYKEYNSKKEFADGYRIQIMYTNVRDEAYREKAVMYREYPELSSYVEYEQPYYKLRLGDFKTRLEASYYLQKILPLNTGAFIVKDKIRIK